MSFFNSIRENIDESLLLGSSFKDLYSFYKLLPEENNLTEEEKLRFSLSSYLLQIIDTSLYLDLFDSEEANSYLTKMKNLFLMKLTDYEKQYGPISHFSFLDYNEYLFPKTRWPFN